MRRIEFKGVSVIDGHWVHGYYFYDAIHDRHFILTHDIAGNMQENKVVPNSVCQLVGLIADHGKGKLYEHDIVETKKGAIAEIRFNRHYSAFMAFIVAGGSWIILRQNNDNPPMYLGGNNFNVIGNSINNPELLEEEKNANA